MKNMTLITPSEWLAGLVRQSFLRCYPIEVRHNTVDKYVFKPTPSDFREKHGLQDKMIILGVSNIWVKTKGLDDLIELSLKLRSQSDKYQVVIVGLSDKQIKRINTTSPEILALPRTDDAAHLAEIYTVADVFVNPSKQETFGMTTLEALSCGTQAIVYEGTACEEVARMYGGIVVEPGVENIYDWIVSG